MSAWTKAPDGTYVGGSEWTLAPDGTYVGGSSWTQAPDGTGPPVSWRFCHCWAGMDAGPPRGMLI